MKLDVECKEKSSLCKLEEKNSGKQKQTWDQTCFIYKQKRTSELSETFSSIAAQESLHDHD